MTDADDTKEDASNNNNDDGSESVEVAMEAPAILLRAPMKYRGMVGAVMAAHHPVLKAGLGLEDAHLLPAQWKTIGKHVVPYYGPTVVQPLPTSWSPSTDCDGLFMSSKFMTNNNCYAYACDIATNSFPQPGRAHNLWLGRTPTGPVVTEYAEKDGLQDLGPEYPSEEHLQSADGHCVALVIAAPIVVEQGTLFYGDYHWARFDQTQQMWSQKDGPDQITNFDFAGKPISNPADANWTVNGGPISKTLEAPEIIVIYTFHTFMFVPKSGVEIF